MKKAFLWLKKEPMLILSVAAAIAGLFITPPSKELLTAIDWRTLGTLLMMLCVLEGFKKEDLFRPLINLASNLRRMVTLTLFLVFAVFFSSMFVTNDVSLLIFVPLTIMLFRAAGKERYILPVISMENIAAIRGSLLMPFGSPQNLFLYGQANISAWRFMLHMLPLCATSGLLLVGFIFFLYRRDPKESAIPTPAPASHERLESAPATAKSCDADADDIPSRDAADPDGDGGAAPWRFTPRRTAYLALFILILAVIVTRTGYWYIALASVIGTIALADRRLFLRVDYVLLVTFLCFFVFSSSIAANESIASFLERSVEGREYWWAIGLSQIISNVPASIVLYPFSKNFAGLIYGADTAGLCSLIGSLASVINYRLYVREYPGNGRKFVKTFTLVSWAFFAIVVVPGLLLSAWDFFA